MNPQRRQHADDCGDQSRQKGQHQSRHESVHNLPVGKKLPIPFEGKPAPGYSGPGPVKREHDQHKDRRIQKQNDQSDVTSAQQIFQTADPMEQISGFHFSHHIADRFPSLSFFIVNAMLISTKIIRETERPDPRF